MGTLLTYAVLALFGVCVGVLNLICLITGLSYEEVSVIVNLWLQPAIMWVLTIAVLICAALRHKSVVIPVIMTVLCSLLCYWVIVHYGFNTNHAFATCVNDLNSICSHYPIVVTNKYISQLPKHLDISYYVLNLLIFVIGFLAYIWWGIANLKHKRTWKS